MNKKIILLIIIFVAVFFEFSRDYIFINTNLKIKYISELEAGLNSFDYTDSTFSLIIKNLSLKQLKISKWLMTLFFFIIYFVLGIITAFYVWGKNKIANFTRIYVFGGLLILFFSLCFYFTSIYFENGMQYDFYLISIELSHFIQSSLYPITFLLIFYYFTKINIEGKY